MLQSFGFMIHPPLRRLFSNADFCSHSLMRYFPSNRITASKTKGDRVRTKTEGRINPLAPRAYHDCMHRGLTVSGVKNQ
jgi:hypothetical protein